MPAVVLCIILALTTCKTLNTILQEPHISLHSVEMSKFDFNGAELLCKIQVENPNAVNIPFPEVGWELFLNNNSFINGVVKNSQRIRARETTLVEVPVRFNHFDLFKTFQSLMGDKQTAYKIALDTKFSIPVIGDKTWHFEHRGNIPLLQFLTLRAPSMRIDSMDLSKAEILVTANIENPNTIEMPKVKVTWDYLVNRNSFLKGSTETPGPLAASSVTPVNFRFSVNYADLYRSFQSLQNISEVPTLLNMTFDFGIIVFGSDTFKIEVPGTLPLRGF